MEQGNLSKALEYHSKSLDINQKIGNKQGIALNLSNIADVYVDRAKALHSKGEISKIDSFCKAALDIDRKALSIDREIGNKDGMSTVLASTGNVYLLQKKYGLAKAYLDSALTVSKEIGQKEDIANSYKYLVVVDSSTGNITGAFADYKMYIQCRDSLVNDANKQKSMQIQMNYAFARRMDSSKAFQDKLNLIEEKKSQKQKMLLYSFIGGFTLMLALAFLIFLGYRQKQKSKLLLLIKKNWWKEKTKRF